MFPGCLSTPATPFSFSTPYSPSHFFNEITSSNGVSPHPLTKRQLGQRRRRQRERQRQSHNRSLTIHSPLHGDGAKVVVETNDIQGRRLKCDAECDDSVRLFFIPILRYISFQQSTRKQRRCQSRSLPTSSTHSARANARQRHGVEKTTPGITNVVRVSSLNPFH